MNLELGNSCHDLAHFSCENVTEHELNSTDYASQVVAGSYALLFYLVLLVLSFVGVCFKSCVKPLSLSSQATSVLFLMGTMTVGVNIFTNADNLFISIVFRLAVGFLVGIAFVLVGALLFFSKSVESATNPPTLGRQQPSMGLVVGAITIPLIIAEIFLFVAALASKKEQASQTEAHQTLWILVVVDKATFLLQKSVQAFIYIYVLRYKTICSRYKENAQFYLKTLAFYNFIEWVDSQVNVDSDVQLSQPELIYEPWFDVFVALYKALIIDYRLLCSLLFLEHSFEDEAVGDAVGSDEPNTRNLTISEQKCGALGFIVGFMSLSAPIVCVLYYIPKLCMPAWVLIFAIIVNLAIVGCGVLFLRKNDLESDQERNMGSSGVKIMVCSVCVPYVSLNSKI